MGETKADPRWWDDRGSWVAESLGSVLDRTPAFGRRFLIAAFSEFPVLAAVTQFVRRSEQPEDVYGVINQPPGIYFQIDPALEYLILWDHDGQAEYGDWGHDQVPPALGHVRRHINKIT